MNATVPLMWIRVVLGSSLPASTPLMLFGMESRLSYPIQRQFLTSRINDEAWFKQKYQVDEVSFHEKAAANLPDLLKKWNPKQLILLRAENTDSDNVLEPAEFPGRDKFSVNTSLLYPVMADLRVFKTDLELEVMRYASKIASEAHMAAMKHIRSGHFEYQMERYVSYWKNALK